MDQNSSTFNFRMPWALLLSTLVVLSVEIAFSHLPEVLWQRFRRQVGIGQAPQLQFRSRLETIDSSQPLVVFLGSSQSREGIDTALIKSSLATTALQEAQVVVLGADDAGPAEFYAQLDLVLTYKPDLIVISSNPRKILSNYKAFHELSNYTDSFLTAGKLIWQFSGSVERAALWQYATRAMLYNVFPSARAVRSFRIVQAIQGIAQGDNRGDVEYRYSKALTAPELEKQLRSIGQLTDTAQSPVQERFFTLAIERLVAAHIPVMLLDFPLNPDLGPQVTGGRYALRRSMELQTQLAAKFHVPYVRFDDLPQFLPSDFLDVTHLSASGRDKMSVFVAQCLARFIERSATSEITFAEVDQRFQGGQLR